MYENILQAVGKTPLVSLNNIGGGLQCSIYIKVEFFNAGGTISDRIAVYTIDEAERSRRLKPGGIVVVAASGSTGIGLAIVCALRGNNTVLVMPIR